MYNFKIILHFDTIIVCQEIPIGSKFLLDLSLKYIQNLSLFTTFTAITLTIISSPRLFQMLLTSTSAPLSQAIHIRAAWVFLLKYKSEPLVLLKTFQWLLRVKKKKKVLSITYCKTCLLQTFLSLWPTLIRFAPLSFCSSHNEELWTVSWHVKHIPAFALTFPNNQQNPPC